MSAKDFISDKMSVHIGDSCTSVLELFEQNNFVYLPVVEDENYVGLISLEILISQDHKDIKVEKIRTLLPHIYLHAEDHIIDAYYFIYENNVDIVPVIEENGTYLGFISRRKLMNSLEQILPAIQEKGIIVLEMVSKDYTLTEIAGIVESNDCKILNLNVKANKENPEKIELVLIINKKDVSALVQAFTRYEYKVKEHHSQRKEIDGSLNKKYQMLIKYLNI